MKGSRFILATLAVLITLAGCDATRTPTSPAKSSLLGLSLPSLFECRTSQETVGQAFIGSAGGVLRVGRHFLEVPAGALSSDVLISGRAPAGDHVTLELQPHGLTFAREARLELSYEHCGLGGLLLKIVYVDDQQSILEILPSVNALFRQRVSTGLSHFSSYMLAN